MLSVSTASAANFACVTLASKILAVVTASSAISATAIEPLLAAVILPWASMVISAAV